MEDKRIRKEYKILHRYVDKEGDHTTIYYIVKRKKKCEGCKTIKEIMEMKPFEDEVNPRL